MAIKEFNTTDNEANLILHENFHQRFLELREEFFLQQKDLSDVFHFLFLLFFLKKSDFKQKQITLCLQYLKYLSFFSVKIPSGF